MGSGPVEVEVNGPETTHLGPDHFPRPTSHSARLLLFDLDGTLLQPADPLHSRAFTEVLAAVAGFTGSIDWTGTSGMVDRAILALLLQRAGLSMAEARRELSRTCRLMAESYRRGAPHKFADRTLPGARPLLSALREQEALMALVTGNIGAIAWGRVTQAGLRDYFIGGAFGHEAMRRATLVRRAIRRSELTLRHTFSPEHVTVIGDTPRDIQAAHAVGVRCVAVATGEYSVTDLLQHGPEAVLDSLEDTERVLARLLR